MKPNFFVVGCPRCGTTSLHYFLKKHPDILLSNRKEPKYLFFIDDLTIGKLRSPVAKSEKEYLAHFKPYRNENIIGDISPILIFSENAANKIHQFNPNSKILIILRNPVDLIISFHNLLMTNFPGHFPELDEFINMEHKIENGKWNGYHCMEAQLYKKFIYSLPRKIKQYKNLFDNDNVLLITLEELQKNTDTTLKLILKFLLVDENYEYNFNIYNKSKHVKHQNSFFIIDKIANVISFLIPKHLSLYESLRFHYRNICNKLFFRDNGNNISQSLRVKLTEEFMPVTKELEMLLGKEMPEWHSVD